MHDYKVVMCHLFKKSKMSEIKAKYLTCELTHLVVNLFKH